MAQHQKHKKAPPRSAGLFTKGQGIIAAAVAVAILSGGVDWLNRSTAFLHLGGILNDTNATDLLIAAIAVVAGLALLFWRHHWGVSHRWATEVLDIRSLHDIYAMSPGRFEELVAFLFQQKGYTVQVVGQAGDQGIDIELRQHGERLVAQCKRYQGSVGQPIVREFYGSFANEATAGYLVTTGTFTQPARQWAATRPIHLIDGAALMRWTEETAHRVHNQGGMI